MSLLQVLLKNETRRESQSMFWLLSRLWLHQPSSQQRGCSKIPFNCRRFLSAPPARVAATTMTNEPSAEQQPSRIQPNGAERPLRWRVGRTGGAAPTGHCAATTVTARWAGVAPSGIRSRRSGLLRSGPRPSRCAPDRCGTDADFPPSRCLDCCRSGSVLLPAVWTGGEGHRTGGRCHARSGCSNRSHRPPEHDHAAAAARSAASPSASSPSLCWPC